ncbi:SprT family protein [Vagococcus coleopterorum]|uniref:SprT family protein n=1 Tax=Vagococcus coleopterorum TaxID=2714946 RepID=A0A6G8APM5_9ENTE|nr:SprT family protein [Vagococcus coleopterorum]QIL46919.1 SprT family protein [Vagococcus coleopterorum]
MTTEQLLKQETLQSMVEAVSLEFFSKPFKHHATYNRRLQTTGGRYHLGSHDLDFNPKVVEVYGEEELIKVIKHELCHYHLHIEGKGYQHRDRDFKELLKATGGTRFVPPLVEKKKRAPKYLYQCKTCGKAFPRQRKINLWRYGCPCGGRLKLIK